MFNEFSRLPVSSLVPGDRFLFDPFSLWAVPWILSWSFQSYTGDLHLEYFLIPYEKIHFSSLSPDESVYVPLGLV